MLLRSYPSQCAVEGGTLTYMMLFPDSGAGTVELAYGTGYGQIAGTRPQIVILSQNAVILVIQVSKATTGEVAERGSLGTASTEFELHCSNILSAMRLNLVGDFGS